LNLLGGGGAGGGLREGRGGKIRKQKDSFFSKGRADGGYKSSEPREGKGGGKVYWSGSEKK